LLDREKLSGYIFLEMKIIKRLLQINVAGRLIGLPFLQTVSCLIIDRQKTSVR
jgi:hypothetical protein